MQPLHELHPPDLLYEQLPAIGADFRRGEAEADDAVDKRVQRVSVGRGKRVHHDGGAVLSDQMRLENVHVQSIHSIAASEMTEFREAVDHQSRGLYLVDPGLDQLNHLHQLYFRRVEHALLALIAHDPPQVRQVHDLVCRLLLEKKHGEGFKLLLRFGERDEEGGLVVLSPGQQILQGQCRLGRTWLTFDEIKTTARQPALQDMIQSANAGQDAWRRDWLEHRSLRLRVFPYSTEPKLQGNRRRGRYLHRSDGCDPCCGVARPAVVT